MVNKYPLSLQSRILDLISEKEILLNELQSVRKMVTSFKQTEEKSQKIIFELQAKYNLLKEEKAADKDNFERRINNLIRGFVRSFNTLAE